MIRNHSLLKVLLFSFFSLIANASVADSSLGMNMPSTNYWTRGIIFVDVFKQNTGWVPQHVKGGKWNTGAKLELDENGWLKSLGNNQAAGTLLMTQQQGHYPAGKYTCLFDGEGRINFGRDASVMSRSEGSITLNVKPSNAGIYLKIVKTNPDNPIRNIRVIMPGYEDTYQEEPYYPPFIEKLKGFDVIRYMRWTIEHPEKNWEKRTTPEYYSQGSNNPIALDYIIDLSNKLGIDPWVNVPHVVSNDYIKKMAEFFKDNLDSERKVYLEFSNEVWNSIFPQAKFALKQGIKLKLDKNKYTAQHLWYAKRATEVFKIWEDVFDSNRLITVIATIAVNPWVGKTILEYKDTAEHTDAIAIAPYFGGQAGNSKNMEKILAMNMDELFDFLDKDIDQQMEKVDQYAALAKKYNIKLLAYEGGQHLAPSGKAQDNQKLVNLLIEANRDDRMYDAYKRYLTEWFNRGGSTFTLFELASPYSKFGSFGLMEYLDQPLSETPKYRLARDVLDGNVDLQ